MCDTCGCSQPSSAVTIRKPGSASEHDHKGCDCDCDCDGNCGDDCKCKEHGHEHGHDHHHEHEHGHSHHHHEHGHGHSHHHHHHEHGHGHSRTVEIEQNVLLKNNMLAERNRGFFEAKGILALNLVSSPGSGKTTVLEQTISDLKDSVDFAVIEGDQQSMRDADRIHATGVPVVQVNTGKGCHLDAEMVNRSIKSMELAENSVLLIENVGNLVCPALFDLGEAMKVVVISVTEGDDKPQKYPTMFDAAEVCIINKVDLLPHVDFDVEKCKQYALEVNHHLKFYEVSAKTGEGMKEWEEWLVTKTKKAAQA